MEQPTLFEEGFLEDYAGKIIESRKTAIIELIANAWDAGATKVIIKWPDNDGDEFYIEDNGHGMSESEFNTRFRTLNYNRIRHQNKYAEIPIDNKDKISTRTAFGKNGKGRLAGFSFGNIFYVTTWKNNEKLTYEVSKNLTNNLPAFKKINSCKFDNSHGTKVFVKNSFYTEMKSDAARTEIGMRFLTDPNFRVALNNELISFKNIPQNCFRNAFFDIENIGRIEIKIIDILHSDKTTLQHGIAWHVNNRLVGECTWKGSGSEYLIDGRKIAAKRYIFIINANCLENSILPDWSGFIPTDNKWQKVSGIVHNRIKEFLLEISKERREEVFKEIESSNKNTLVKLGLANREKWEKFIRNVQTDCPSISTDDLEKLGALLAKLETSESKFNLINILSNVDNYDLDKLNTILLKWDIDFAKLVLDEIEYRTTLIEKLQQKINSVLTKEVQELQPLFYRGLWIFGPEYESIEFTSNQGMTKVIQDLFGIDLKGSMNRPDFAILTDGTVGLYALPEYDEYGGEIGVERLTIIELKKPGIKISLKEINQPWNYVKELYQKGLLSDSSKVICFVLGSELEPLEAERTTKKDGKVVIQPLNYDTVLRRAKSRLLNLHDKINKAPFLRDARIKAYLEEKSQKDLF